MKAYDGQDILDLYVSALKAEQPGITVDEVDNHITGWSEITLVQFCGDWFQFRIETDTSLQRPICQYVKVSSNGEMTFRESKNWFVPGDVLFDTFAEALDYVKKLFVG